jgi:hypothetical protein
LDTCLLYIVTRSISSTIRHIDRIALSPDSRENDFETMSYEQPYAQPSEQQQSGSEPLEGILIAHVVCGAAATLVLLPFGVLIPRYARALSTGRWWFPLHMAVQIIGIILALVALATGFAQGGAEGAAHPVS